MYAKIIAVGTSKGIRIPKYLLTKYSLENEVNIEDTGEGILIKSLHQPRLGWKEAFQKVVRTSEDHTIALPTSSWDKDEWEW